MDKGFCRRNSQKRGNLCLKAYVSYARMGKRKKFPGEKGGFYDSPVNEKDTENKGSGVRGSGPYAGITFF